MLSVMLMHKTMLVGHHYMRLVTKDTRILLNYCYVMEPILIYQPLMEQGTLSYYILAICIVNEIYTVEPLIKDPLWERDNLSTKYTSNIPKRVYAINFQIPDSLPKGTKWPAGPKVSFTQRFHCNGNDLLLYTLGKFLFDTRKWFPRVSLWFVSS